MNNNIDDDFYMSCDEFSYGMCSYEEDKAVHEMVQEALTLPQEERIAFVRDRVREIEKTAPWIYDTMVREAIDQAIGADGLLAYWEMFGEDYAPFATAIH